MVNVHCPGPLGNPKSESRNPKEGRNPKTERTMRQEVVQPVGSRLVRISGFGFPSGFGFRASDFLRVSGFGIRISRLEFTGNIEEAVLVMAQ